MNTNSQTAFSTFDLISTAICFVTVVVLGVFHAGLLTWIVVGGVVVGLLAIVRQRFSSSHGQRSGT
jgi:hypothetical protein